MSCPSRRMVWHPHPFAPTPFVCTMQNLPPHQPLNTENSLNGFAFSLPYHRHEGRCGDDETGDAADEIEYDEVEEYITESGNKKTVHKKKVRKYFPPDTAAAKSYFNIFDKNYANDRANMEIRKREVAVKEKLANMAEDSEDKVININIT